MQFNQIEYDLQSNSGAIQWDKIRFTEQFWCNSSSVPSNGIGSTEQFWCRSSAIPDGFQCNFNALIEQSHEIGLDFQSSSSAIPLQFYKNSSSLSEQFWCSSSALPEQFSEIRRAVLAQIIFRSVSVQFHCSSAHKLLFTFRADLVQLQCISRSVSVQFQCPYRTVP